MKKSSFVATVLGTVSGVLFALGMCMAMIPEWNAFKPGVVFGGVGIVMALVTWLIWRKMEHKDPIQITPKAILTAVVGIAGALALGGLTADSVIQGVLVTGAAVYGNQIVKQLHKSE